MEIKKFEKEFFDEEMELLVLIQTDVNGAAVVGEYLRPSARFIASVDVKTGEFLEKTGLLQWMIKKDNKSKGWGHDIKGMTIYRVKVRKCIEQELQPYMSEIMNNRYLLLEILEKDVQHDGLEEIRKSYLKVVEIDNEIGHFVLDKDYGWFCGEIDWMGNECRVMLNLDEEGKETADHAMDALHQLVNDLENWDVKVRNFAANQLVELANEWQEEEEEEETEPISKEEFARRMDISELSINADGDMEITFLDDDMFWGHYIVVYANISGELDRAQMEG